MKYTGSVRVGFQMMSQLRLEKHHLTSTRADASSLQTSRNGGVCRPLATLRVALEKRDDRYDVIIGDLADPLEGGPCYQLYTETFYELTVKPRLMEGGIIVTQAGPPGDFSRTEVFCCIFNTLKTTLSFMIVASTKL